MSDIFVNDIGTTIKFTVMQDGSAIDVSTATVKKVKFQRKDKTTFSRDVSFVTDGTDGLVSYTTVNGDLDQAGKWTAQLYMELPSWSGHTSKITFTVQTPIEVV